MTGFYTQRSLMRVSLLFDLVISVSELDSNSLNLRETQWF